MRGSAAAIASPALREDPRVAPGEDPVDAILGSGCAFEAAVRGISAQRGSASGDLQGGVVGERVQGRAALIQQWHRGYRRGVDQFMIHEAQLSVQAMRRKSDARRC